MNAGFEWRCPTCSVYTRSSVFGTLDRLPVYKKGDGILGFRYAVVRVTRCDTRCGTRDHSGWHGKVLEDPAADVDVMGRKVVTLDHKEIFPVSQIKFSRNRRGGNRNRAIRLFQLT